MNPEGGIWIDNAVIGEYTGKITFSMHLCRGNQQSRWLVEGGYDKIARQVFQNVSADRLLLEYDDNRSGSFEPLRLVPDDKTVVLGLVSTKDGELERRATWSSASTTRVASSQKTNSPSAPSAASPARLSAINCP